MIVSTTKYYPNALSTTNRVFPHFLVLSVVNLFNHSSNKYASKRNISVDKTSFFDFFSEPIKNILKTHSPIKSQKTKKQKTKKKHYLLLSF